MQHYGGRALQALEWLPTTPYLSLVIFLSDRSPASPDNQPRLLARNGSCAGHADPPAV